MAIQIEVDNRLQSYFVVKGLVDQLEFEKKHGSDDSVAAIEGVLEQFEGQPAHTAFIEGGD